MNVKDITDQTEIYRQEKLKAEADLRYAEPSFDFMDHLRAALLNVELLVRQINEQVTRELEELQREEHPAEAKEK